MFKAENSNERSNLKAFKFYTHFLINFKILILIYVVQSKKIQMKDQILRHLNSNTHFLINFKITI